MVKDAKDLVGTAGRAPVRAVERVRDYAQAAGPKCHVLQGVSGASSTWFWVDMFRRHAREIHGHETPTRIIALV